MSTRLLLLSLFVSIPTFSHAYTCKTQTVSLAYNSAGAVFIGRVISNQKVERDDVFYRRITFRVKEVWKSHESNIQPGKITEINEYRLNPEKTQFEPFKDYLVFSRLSTEGYRIDTCDAVMPLTNDYNVVRELDKMQASTASSEPYWKRPIYASQPPVDIKQEKIARCLRAAHAYGTDVNECENPKF